MKKYDLLTPEGTRDLIFDECAALRSISGSLREIFVSRGFSEVITPGLEFFDVFNSKSRSYSQEAMYKLTDAKGRILVLRPDSTMPIARLVGTRLKDSPLPLKLYYDQTIYRAHPKDSGRDDEFFQCGAEIIGGDITKSDIEALTLAAEVMSSFNEEDFRFEIGDSTFFTALCAPLPLSENEQDTLRELVFSKNYPELDAMMSGFGENKYARALAKLPALFGGKEVFSAAREVLPDETTAAALGRLEKLYETVKALGMGDKVSVDLGMVGRNEDYYTGLVFKGYIHGYGMPVLTGGRYNGLLKDFGADIPAIGFAVNENAAAAALLKRSGNELSPAPKVLIFFGEENAAFAAKHRRELIASGLTAEYSDHADLSQAREYAARRGISRLHVIEADEKVSEEVLE